MEKNPWQAYYPSGIQANLKLSGETLVEQLQVCSHKYQKQTAYEHEGKKLSFVDIEKLSHAFSSYLQSLNHLSRGDRIIIQLPNSLAFPVCLFGSWRAALCIVPSNPLYTKTELIRQFNDAQAKVWVTTSLNLKIISEVVSKTTIEHVIVSDIFDFHWPAKRLLAKLALRWRSGSLKTKIKGNSLRSVLFQGRIHKKPDLKLDASELALLQYTGGSSGIWKGAMLHHSHLKSNVEQMQSFIQRGSYERQTLVAALPLYHIFSLSMHCLAGVAMGNRVILVLDPTRTEELARTIARSEMTAFAGLNPLFHSLMRNKTFKNIRFNKLKLTISGGMALNPDIGRQWEAMTSCPVLEGFGMSETSPAVSINPPEKVKYGTIGVPLPDTQIRIMSSTEEEITEPGLQGELQIKGPQVMSGYWNGPEQTRLQLSEDGWLKTGDLACYDEDYYLKITGRSKRMIIVSGFNVYPNEVEQVLESHPQVLTAKVSSTPHKITGETICAEIYVKRPIPEPSAIRSFCKLHLAPYKVPRTVTIIEGEDTRP